MNKDIWSFYPGKNNLVFFKENKNKPILSQKDDLFLFEIKKDFSFDIYRENSHIEKPLKILNLSFNLDRNIFKLSINLGEFSLEKYKKFFLEENLKNFFLVLLNYNIGISLALYKLDLIYSGEKLILEIFLFESKNKEFENEFLFYLLKNVYIFFLDKKGDNIFSIHSFFLSLGINFDLNTIKSIIYKEKNKKYCFEYIYELFIFLNIENFFVFSKIDNINISLKDIHTYIFIKNDDDDNDDNNNNNSYNNNKSISKKNINKKIIFNIFSNIDDKTIDNIFVDGIKKVTKKDIEFYVVEEYCNNYKEIYYITKALMFMFKEFTYFDDEIILNKESFKDEINLTFKYYSNKIKNNNEATLNLLEFIKIDNDYIYFNLEIQKNLILKEEIFDFFTKETSESLNEEVDKYVLFVFENNIIFDYKTIGEIFNKHHKKYINILFNIKKIKYGGIVILLMLYLNLNIDKKKGYIKNVVCKLCKLLKL